MIHLMEDEVVDLIERLGDVPTRYDTLQLVYLVREAIGPDGGAYLDEPAARELLKAIGDLPTKYGLTGLYKALKMRLAHLQQHRPSAARDGLDGIVQEREQV